MSEHKNGQVFGDRINAHKILSGKHELTESLRRLILIKI